MGSCNSDRTSRSSRILGRNPWIRTQNNNFKDRMANVMNWSLLVIAFIGCLVTVYFFEASAAADSKREVLDAANSRHREKRSFFDTNRYWDAPRGEKRSFFDTNSNWDVPSAKRSFFPEPWGNEKRFWETEMSWPRGKRGSSTGGGYWDGPSSDWTSRGKRYISPSCKKCLFGSDDWVSCAACYRRGSLVPFYGQKKRTPSSAEADSVGKRSYETSFYGLEGGDGTCFCCNTDSFDYSCCAACLKK